MITFDRERFSNAAVAFLTHFGLPGAEAPRDYSSLRELYLAFTHIPYENLSKIIRSHHGSDNSSPEFRTPDQVLEGYLSDRLGGTCFSLTQCLFSLLCWCGFNCWRVLGDMRHGQN
ncbi:MAG: hypothetical protein U9N45_05045, partial [Gemmatimonadota bacterium]|nr:hypothetical protein [Gemmatimonadota bacterium]